MQTCAKEGGGEGVTGSSNRRETQEYMTTKKLS